MKTPKLFKCVFVLSLIALADQSFGQGFYTPTRINTPYGPATIQTYHHMPMRYYHGPNGESMKHQFTIVLKNDSVFAAKTIVKANETTYFVQIKNGKEKTRLLPNQTKEIFWMDPAKGKMSGVASDTCWLFTMVKGKINLYSPIPEYLAEPVAFSDSEDGRIIKLDSDRLLEYIGYTDTKLVNMITRKDYHKAVARYNKKFEKDAKK